MVRHNDPISTFFALDNYDNSTVCCDAPLHVRTSPSIAPRVRRAVTHVWEAYVHTIACQRDFVQIRGIWSYRPIVTIDRPKTVTVNWCRYYVCTILPYAYFWCGISLFW